MSSRFAHAARLAAPARAGRPARASRRPRPRLRGRGRIRYHSLFTIPPIFRPQRLFTIGARTPCRKACEFWSAMMTASTRRASACSRTVSADGRRGDRGRAGPRSLRRQQLADARPADPRRRARRRPLARRRHADRLRASRAVGPARSRARHRRFRHQQFGQPRRRRDLFRHRVRRDGRAFPRLPGDRDLAGQRSITRACTTKARPKRCCC